MATYNPSLSYQRECFSTPFPGDNKFSNCLDPTSSHPDNVNMYVNPASSTELYSEILSVGSSLSPRNCVEVPSTGGMNGKMFIPSTGDAVVLPSIDGQLNAGTGNVIPTTQPSVLDGEQNFQCQGLSLSLSTQMTSAVSVPSFQHQYSNPRFSSFLRTHLSVPGKGTMPCQDNENETSKELRSSEGMLPGFQAESPFNTQCSIGHNEMHSGTYQYEPIGFNSTILKSKHLKAAQQLLDEVVNIQKALKLPNSNKNDAKETDGRSSSMLPAFHGIPSNPTESISNSSSELSHAERQELLNKKTKLLSVLEEVDRGYKQYYHQMQIVASSFDMVAGHGAAKSYTVLALQTISRHFRSLRDAISEQIQVTGRSLGEQETSSNGQASIPRLRFVDHQSRQQRALQQLGVMRHAWRPQRGLPESSVSILRAWLFEHFLHPYPNDSEKIMLAKQTGLSRNQVANWFINARVRLWKPMIEDMYKEEFGDTEENSKSCLENANKASSQNSSAPENRGEELQDSLSSKSGRSIHDVMSNYIPDVEMNKPTASSLFQEGSHGDNVLNSGIMRLQNDQRPNINDHRLYASIPHNQNGNDVLMGASAATYGIQELRGYAISNQVSLALGLRHQGTDVFPVSAGNNIGGDKIAVSSEGHDTADYHCMDLGNQEDRFGNPQLLHDFVV